MKEIKSVRVRIKFDSTDENLNGLSDYKVILYDNGQNKFKVSAGQIGRVFLNSEYRKEGRYQNFSNDDFIKDGINVLISKQNGNKEFEIIQDPWLDIPPKWRSFGSTPYYLNNGAKVTIQWLSGTTSAGGKKWSDDDGKELSTSKNPDDDPKSYITKIVTIWSPDSYKGRNKRLKITQLGIEGVIDKQDNPLPFTDELKYSGLMLDKDIISSIISYWNSQVPNYNLSICNPDYIKCEITPYISPVDELQDIEKKLETPEEPKSVKEKLNVILPKDLNLKIKQDISFKIFVGDPPKTEKPVVDGFDFGDEDDLSDLLLEDEFREDVFSGNEESFNEIIDEPPGPNPDENLPGSPVFIPGLDPNSKLLAKVGKNYYIVDSGNGLAGKRLRNLMDGLQSYISKQYPGTKIGFNGVMRDLVASTYPNSPKRAVASLHGAGLAIDVTFNIPGKKWSGIGDNKNLATDEKLNKLIYDYVKSQGDITWGGEWGTKDGTKAEVGVVKGWGVTEYHHFEIKASKILDYWSPFKDQVISLGIDFNKLNQVGRGSQLEKLNKILLSSVNITV